MHRSDILKAADALINGEREAAYGPPIINFTNIAKGWSVLLGVEVSAAQVASCMAWLKMCRLINTPDHTDSHIDAAAYSALAGELAGGTPMSREEREAEIKTALANIPSIFRDGVVNKIVPGFEYSGTSFIDPEADGPTDFGR